MHGVKIAMGEEFFSLEWMVQRIRDNPPRIKLREVRFECMKSLNLTECHNKMREKHKDLPMAILPVHNKGYEITRQLKSLMETITHEDTETIWEDETR